jgi:hypothetical protein
VTVRGNTTVVAVHGAWAYGSSWKDVILGLEGQGLRVIAAPIPLTSLGDDTAALKRSIARSQGPVILGAHAYAGAVIAAVNDERVKALVYVAGLAPDEGETVAQVFCRDEKHSQSPQLAPDADGFIWMPDEGFRNAFSHHATAEQIALSAGVQRPIALKCIQEQVPTPAWRSRPSWYLIARGGPHDQPQNATLYGETNESNYKVARRRSHTTAERATESCGHHHGSEAGSVLLSGR